MSTNITTSDLFMLCHSTTSDELENYSDNKKYQANYKYDGERVMVAIENDKIIMFNRRGNIINRKFKDVEKELRQIDFRCILDGEIISEDDDFNKLQKRALSQNKAVIEYVTKNIKVNYMIFDVISFEGKDVRSYTLKERLKMVAKVFENKNFDILKKVEYYNVQDIYDLAKNENREGIVIKDLEGTYQSSKRSRNWLKLKFFKEGELDLTTYTDNPKGIRGEDSNGNAIQISGRQSQEVKDILDNKGSCRVYIQYLSQSPTTKRYRFPSYRGLVNGNDN